jgi:two-component system NtrC family sensor kinase
MDDNLRAEDARLAAQVERLRAELAVAREQQTATSEILRVIASSPDDVQPVLDTLRKRAAIPR